MTQERRKGAHKIKEDNEVREEKKEGSGAGGRPRGWWWERRGKERRQSRGLTLCLPPPKHLISLSSHIPDLLPTLRLQL